MDGFGLIFPSFVTGKIDRVSIEVATKSQSEVASRCQNRDFALSVAELRGFVRAMAGAVVRKQYSITFKNNHRLKRINKYRDQIIQQATDRLVRLVSREILSVQYTSAGQRKAS